MLAHGAAGPTTAAVVGPAGAPCAGPVGGPVGARADGGFSLVEVIVSLGLLVVVATAGALALTTSIRYAESNDSRVVAAGLAAAQVEQARAAADPGALEAGTTAVTRNGTTFTVARELAPPAGCSADGTRTITITVSWTGRGGPVQSDTVRAC